MSGDVYKIMERLESRSNLGFSCHLSRQIRLPPRPGSGTGPAERQDTAESSTTLPAWCVAASGTGTRYNSVEIQRAACTLTIANAAATACSAARGNAARTATRLLDAKSSAVARYVVIAITRWSNWTVVGFSNRLRHMPLPPLATSST